MQLTLRNWEIIFLNLKFWMWRLRRTRITFAKKFTDLESKLREAEAAHKHRYDENQQLRDEIDKKQHVIDDLQSRLDKVDELCAVVYKYDIATLKAQNEEFSFKLA